MDRVFGTVVRWLPASAGFFTQGYGDLASVHALNREVRHCLSEEARVEASTYRPPWLLLLHDQYHLHASTRPPHSYAFDGLGFRRSILAAVPN